MPEFVLVVLTGLLPLAIVVAIVVLLKRIADSIDRLEGTLDRRLLDIEEALDRVEREAET